MTGKTIKQIAEELGVSKTAVNKEIRKLGLRTKLKKNGNQFVVCEEEEKTIISAFRDRTANQKPQTKTANQSQTEKHINDELVCVLKEQIQTQKEQIEQLNKALEREQILHGRTQEKLLVLEDKQAVDETIEKKKWYQFWK